MATDETTGLLTAAERAAMHRIRDDQHTETDLHSIGALLAQASRRDDATGVWFDRTAAALLWADDRARELIAAAEARGVARALARAESAQQIAVEAYAEHRTEFRRGLCEASGTIAAGLRQLAAASVTTPPATGATEGAVLGIPVKVCDAMPSDRIAFVQDGMVAAVAEITLTPPRTLTDAEREIARCLDGFLASGRVACVLRREDAATLRGLLARDGGTHG